MPKRLLFVTTRLPFPPDSGRKVSLYHYCRGLSRDYGYEVDLFVFPEGDDRRDGAGKPDFISDIYFAHPIRRRTKAMNLLFRSFLSPRRWPFQCALYYSARNARAIASLCREKQYDAVVFDMIRTAPYLSAVPGDCRRVLDMDDLLSRRYERQLLSYDGKAGVAGRYGLQMRAGLEKHLCHGRAGKMILRGECRRLRCAEPKMARLFDSVILVSQAEADILNEWLGEKRAVPVPMGVEARDFAPAMDAEKEENLIGFVGNLGVSANLSALSVLTGEILPLLPKEVRLEVVGKCPPEVAERFRNEKRVLFRGMVPDLPPVAGRWQLTIAPFPYGSGLKTKVLEAMAMGLPVVTNPVGAEGIGAPKDLLFVGETPAQMAALATRLLSDPAACRAAGLAGAAFVWKHFSWDGIFGAFAEAGL